MKQLMPEKLDNDRDPGLEFSKRQSLPGSFFIADSLIKRYLQPMTGSHRKKFIVAHLHPTFIAGNTGNTPPRQTEENLS